MVYSNKKITNIPKAPGVYLMRDASAKIIYIGKARNLKSRVASYFRADTQIKTSSMIASLRHIDFVLTASESEALVLENKLIKQYQPYYNVMWKDDKSYPYLKLTSKEDFPRLFLTRKLVRQKDDSASTAVRPGRSRKKAGRFKEPGEYFGPYPHVRQAKILLKWLQRVFKWRMCRFSFGYKSLPAQSKIKPCLYLHTKRCIAPCTGRITPREYKNSLNEIRLFLKGKYKSLLKLWKKQMKHASDNLNFEKASEIRDRIRALDVTGEKVTIRELKAYDLTTSIKTTNALKDLKGILSLSTWPLIIEGFDISNISGIEPVGSMVRFHNGQPDKSNYRKFRIKHVSGINDIAMIAEVVYRRYLRLSNQKQKLPDLILIDGGKGQLHSANESLKKLKLRIPIISIAKKRRGDIYNIRHKSCQAAKRLKNSSAFTGNKRRIPQVCPVLP